MYNEFLVCGEEVVDVFDQTLDHLLSQIIFLSDIVQSVSLSFHYHIVCPKICCLREEFTLHLGLHIVDGLLVPDVPVGIVLTARAYHIGKRACAVIPVKGFFYFLMSLKRMLFQDSVLKKAIFYQT